MKKEILKKPKEELQKVYRAIYKHELDLYYENPEAIPNIQGSLFKQNNSGDNTRRQTDENGNVTRDYEEGKSYLHFFEKEENATVYARALRDQTNQSVCVVEFQFDKQILDENKQTGFYSNDPTLPNAEKQQFVEYAIPLDQFNPKENIVGIVKEISYDPDCYQDYFF